MASEIRLPQLGLTMNEGLIVEWRKKTGDSVRKGEILFLVENEKATIEVEAQADGILAKILVPDETTVAVGTVVGLIASPGEAVGSEPTPPGEVTTEERPAASEWRPVPQPERPVRAAAKVGVLDDGFVLASPLVRRRAQEEGFDLAAFQGTGPEGAVVERDLPPRPEALSRPRPGRTQAPRESDISIDSAASFESEEISLSRIGTISAERLTRSWTTIPQFSVFIEASAAGLLDLHSQFRKRGLPVSITVILVKILALSLTRFPRLNAQWLGGGKVRVYKRVNVGIAMDTEEGLVAPVLRDCAAKAYRQLAEEMRALVDRGQRGALTSGDFTEETVTLSNLGMFGVKRFNAILNPPQTAIVSIGAIDQKPVERSGNLVFERYLEIGLSADHRVADGAYAARFLADFKAVVENPPCAED